MAVANAWATGHSVTHPPQLPPSSSETLNKKFRLNFSNKVSIRRRKNYRLSCCCSHNLDNDRSYDDGDNTIDINSLSICSPSSSADWDWNRWSRHFSEMEQAENHASLLKLQLDDAIENEDYEEAAKLKIAIVSARLKDSIAEIMSDLKNAVNEERYTDASRLCRDTGSGLVGWWVGFSKDSTDPYGRIIQISPGTGRLIAKCYSPRQLIRSLPGKPLFEIFVVKDVNETYNMKVVFLKQTKGNSKKLSSLSDKSNKGPSSSETGNASAVDAKLEESESEKGDENSIDLEAAPEETIKSVLNFLKEKLKVKLARVNVAEDISEDTIKQFMEDESESSTSDDSEEEASDVDKSSPDRIAGQGDSDTMEDESPLEMKFLLDGFLHNKEDIHRKEDIVRVPADIGDIEKDSFVLHIPKKDLDKNSKEDIASRIKVSAIAAQGLAHLMPPEVALALGSDKMYSKVYKYMRETLSAATEVRRQDWTSECTNFSRITTSRGNLDPFEGLYIGAFGPFGIEVVQLRHKYGNWNTSNDESSSMEFFEYVEAVKLTGDLNVPAGQVTFRAKLGKDQRVSKRGFYSHELGVVAGYKGQGRIAEVGFQNSRWVEGELLHLNGKGFGPLGFGADLGFLYFAPEQDFIVLFKRLILPE